MLADWATPLASLNARPSHIPAERYYALPVDNLKTYPVYLAGREPKGYWQMFEYDRAQADDRARKTQ